MGNNRDLSSLQQKIGYTFKNIDYLTLALTHSSLSHERVVNKLECNERIEFLGDAVLELTVSDYIFKNMPEKNEGEMTKLRISLVCEPTLAGVARTIDLPDYIMLGIGEEKTGGRNRDSIVSDAFEALLGAIYLDGGIEAAREFVNRFVLTDIEKKSLFYDSKSILQEFAQNKMKSSITYKILSESGPDHNKVFVAQAFAGEQALETGTGHSKKAAEMEAAYKSLQQLKM